MADHNSAVMPQDPAASRLDPFGATLGLQGIYISQSLQQRLDLIEHLLEFGRQIIVLNGASGSGKSTLLGYLSAGQGRNWYCIRIPVGPTLSVRGLEQLIIRELDIEPSDEVEPRTVIRLRLGTLEQAGKVAVLLFDDAEHLTPEVINAIVTLANTEDKLAEFRVLLAADLDHSALLENLQREAPQHGLVHVVEIPRLTAAQVQALIEHRLQGTDVHADDYFSAADYARLTTDAQGLTGHVVTLARQQVAERTRGGHANSAGTRVAWVRKLAFTALALGAIGGGAWLANRHAEPGVVSDTVTVSSAVEAPAPPKPVAPLAPEPASEVPTLTTERAPIVSVPETPSPPTVVDAIGDAPPAVSSVGTTPTPGPPMAATPRRPLSVVEDATPPPLPTPAPRELPKASRATEPTVPATMKIVKRHPTPKAVESPAPHARASKPPAPSAIAARAPREAIKKPPPAAPIVTSYSREWLLKQPANGHVLQLFGVRERGAAQRFVTQHGIAERSVLLSSTLNGKPWYLVTYGYFPSRTAALAAVATLPAPLRATHPWARSIGSLRGALH